MPNVSVFPLPFGKQQGDDEAPSTSKPGCEQDEIQSRWMSREFKEALLKKAAQMEEATSTRFPKVEKQFLNMRTLLFRYRELEKPFRIKLGRETKKQVQVFFAIVIIIFSVLIYRDVRVYGPLGTEFVAAPLVCHVLLVVLYLVGCVMLAQNTKKAVCLTRRYMAVLVPMSSCLIAIPTASLAVRFYLLAQGLENPYADAWSNIMKEESSSNVDAYSANSTLGALTNSTASLDGLFNNDNATFGSRMSDAAASMMEGNQDVSAQISSTEMHRLFHAWRDNYTGVCAAVEEAYSTFSVLSLCYILSFLVATRSLYLVTLFGSSLMFVLYSVCYVLYYLVQQSLGSIDCFTARIDNWRVWTVSISICIVFLTTLFVSYVSYAIDKTARIRYLNDLTLLELEGDRERVVMQEREAKSQLDITANLSHELRTPMHSLSGYMSLMSQGGNLAPDQAGYLTMMETSAKQMIMLIDDFLDYARGRAQEVVLKEVPSSITSAVENVAKEIFYLAYLKEVDIASFVDPSLPPTLVFDYPKLSQVMRNLLSNSAKFTRPRGGIFIRVDKAERAPAVGDDALCVLTPHVRENGKEEGSLTGSERNDGASVDVVISVSDEGPGMSHGVGKSLFKKFYTSDEEGVGTKVGDHILRGTGLGLSIVRNLVLLMGGTIHVQSRVGQGSTFFIRLKLKVGSILSSRERSSPPPGAGQHLSLAEDPHVELEGSLLLPARIDGEDGTAEGDEVGACMPHLVSTRCREALSTPGQTTKGSAVRFYIASPSRATVESATAFAQSMAFHTCVFASVEEALNDIRKWVNTTMEVADAVHEEEPARLAGGGRGNAVSATSHQNEAAHSFILATDICTSEGYGAFRKCIPDLSSVGRDLAESGYRLHILLFKGPIMSVYEEAISVETALSGVDITTIPDKYEKPCPNADALITYAVSNLRHLSVPGQVMIIPKPLCVSVLRESVSAAATCADICSPSISVLECSCSTWCVSSSVDGVGILPIRLAHAGQGRGGEGGIRAQAEMEKEGERDWGEEGRARKDASKNRASGSSLLHSYGALLPSRNGKRQTGSAPLYFENWGIEGHDPAVSAKVTTREQDGGNQHGKVLVADDDHLGRTLAATMLKRSGFDPFLAPDGTDALSAMGIEWYPLDECESRFSCKCGKIVDNANTKCGGFVVASFTQANTEVKYCAKVVDQVKFGQFEAVLLDHNMPLLGGIDVAHILKVLGYEGRLISISGCGDEEGKLLAKSAGFSHFLPKPFTLKSLSLALLE